MHFVRSQLRHASQSSVRRTINDPLSRFLLQRPSRRVTQPLTFIPGYSSLNVLETENYILFGSKKVNQLHEEERLFGPIRHGYNKMKSWVEFLSTPTADTPGTTLLLHFDNKRYLIGNIAEGTQRAAVQRKLGLLKVRNIFLTGTVGWSTAGGLLGMILTLADACTTSREERNKFDAEKIKKRSHEGEDNPKKEGLSIHGGKNLTHLLATARRFIFRHGMPITTSEFKVLRSRQDLSSTWEDENIKVWAMVIAPEGHPGNIRKRSHDEFTDATSAEQIQGVQQEQDGQYDEMLKSVVSAMFDSSWRLDALVKQKLSQVQLPATIFVRDSAGKLENYKGPINRDHPAFSDIDVFIRNPWPGALIENLPHTTPAVNSTCYIIKNHPQRGKFDPKKAMELGVPKGRDFARLTKGESITVPNGDVVTPDMVLGKGKEGGGFAIVELPSSAYVEPLLSRGEWSSKEVMVGVEAIVWILGPGVSSDPTLQKFMADRNELKHIVSSTDCCPNYLALESAASAALRLNCMDPTSFPIPKFSNKIPLEDQTNSTYYEKAMAGQKLLLEPKFEIQNKNTIPYLDTLAVMNETPKEVLELAAIARTQVASQDYQAKLFENESDIPCRDAEIITLGTGSALPSKYRNVSATLVCIPEYGNFLFDCGENTLGQLKRVFGNELPGVLQNLKAIWISHLHADHHLGTVSVIKAWCKETKTLDATKNSKLSVASDGAMLDWLREYAKIEDYGYDRVRPIILNGESGYEYNPKPKQIQELGFSSIQACPVRHCHGAMAVAFSFVNGFKIAYSGDCRPSDGFVQIGQGATLLIHEATFDDELHGDAVAKKHSTTSEALDVGKRMNARRILLTHFSQRYQKIPVIDSDGGKDQVAVVAFDYMKVKLGDFAKMEAFRPALMKLYEETAE